MCVLPLFHSSRISCWETWPEVELWRHRWRNKERRRAIRLRACCLVCVVDYILVSCVLLDCRADLLRRSPPQTFPDSRQTRNLAPIARPFPVNGSDCGRVTGSRRRMTSSLLPTAASVARLRRWTLRVAWLPVASFPIRHTVRQSRGRRMTSSATVVSDAPLDCRPSTRWTCLNRKWSRCQEVTWLEMTSSSRRWRRDADAKFQSHVDISLRLVVTSTVSNLSCNFYTWVLNVMQYKKISCRRKAARCFVSSNLFTKSLKVIWNDTFE